MTQQEFHDEIVEKFSNEQKYEFAKANNFDIEQIKRTERIYTSLINTGKILIGESAKCMDYLNTKSGAVK